MNITAIVVAHNRPTELRMVVSALLGQSVPPSRILIIDNASQQPVAEVLAGFPNVEVIRSEVNTGGAGGFAFALQKALKRDDKGTVQSEWVWMLDDDAVPRPSALEALIKATKGLPDRVGALCSAVYEFDTLALMHRRAFDFQFGWESPIAAAQYQGAQVPIDTSSFVGLLVKTEVARVVGLPDASFFIAYDDTDYSLQIRKAGWSIWLVPQSQIDHLRKRESRMRAHPFGHKHYYNIRNRLVVVRRYADCKILAGAIATVYALGIWSLSQRTFSATSIRLLVRAVSDGWRGRLGRISR